MLQFGSKVGIFGFENKKKWWHWWKYLQIIKLFVGAKLNQFGSNYNNF